jgi:hypothetical protein
MVPAVASLAEGEPVSGGLRLARHWFWATVIDAPGMREAVAMPAMLWAER